MFALIARIKYQSKTIDLYELDKPANDYIIIETIDKKDIAPKTYSYIIKLDKHPTIKIGRTNKVEISMTDNSVSRVHAALHLRNNKFYLEDLRSKCGTLVELQYDCVLLPNKAIGICTEKCLLMFHLKKTCLGLFKCCSSDVFKWSDYNALWAEVSIAIAKEEEVKEIDMSPNVNNETKQHEQIKDSEDGSERNNVNRKQEDNLPSTLRELITSDNNMTSMSRHCNEMNQRSQINLLQDSTLNINGLNENSRNEMIKKISRKISNSRNQAVKINKNSNSNSVSNQSQSQSHSKQYYIKQTSGLKKATISNSSNMTDLGRVNLKHNDIVMNSNDNNYKQNKFNTFNEPYRYNIHNDDDKNSNTLLEEPENESMHIVNENAMLSEFKRNSEAIGKVMTNSQIDQIDQIDDNQIINNCIEDDEPINKSSIRTQKAIQFTLEKTKRK